MARTWNPTLDQIIEARATLANALRFCESLVDDVRSGAEQQQIDAKQDRLEDCLVHVFDACSIESAYAVVARQTALDELITINECEKQDAQDENREPNLLNPGEKGDVIEAVKCVIDRWDRDDRNGQGDDVLEALIAMAKKGESQ